MWNSFSKEMIFFFKRVVPFDANFSHQSGVDSYLHLRQIRHAFSNLPWKGHEVTWTDDVVTETGTLRVTCNVQTLCVQGFLSPHATQIILQRPVLTILHYQVERSWKIQISWFYCLVVGERPIGRTVKWKSWYIQLRSINLWLLL